MQDDEIGGADNFVPGVKSLPGKIQFFAVKEKRFEKSARIIENASPDGKGNRAKV